MWDSSAVGLTYLLSKQFGSVWWNHHWWIAAITLLAALMLAEIAWVLHTHTSERKAKVQADKQMPGDAGVNASLLSVMSDDEDHCIA